MSQRLQVLLDEEEFEEIRRVARRHRMTVAEWVRQTLRKAREDEMKAKDRKLAAIRHAMEQEVGGPAVDIETMLAEIERGYQGGWEP